MLSDACDGIFCPGGSMSNFYGMNLARFAKCQEYEVDIKAKGMKAAPDLVAFVSRDGHYSITKAAAFLGVGTDNIIKVDVDGAGCMLPDDLDAKMQAAKDAGRVPFYIQATAGTTVLGGYDPLTEIVAVAKKYKAWVHVDGCWGGTVALSKKWKHLLAGVEGVDSMAWNPHKMMGIPLQCCAFITTHEGILQNAHASGAKYLFQKDKLNGNLDTGDKSVQCGRKVDTLKLWMAWVAMGDKGYEEHVDNFMAVSRYLAEQVKARDEFVLVAEPTCSNVCFWYLPPSVRAEGGPAEGTQEWKDIVHKGAATIKQRMQEKGSCMIGFQSVAIPGDSSPPNFWRMVVMAEKAANSQMDFLLDEINLLGQDL